MPHSGAIFGTSMPVSTCAYVHTRGAYPHPNPFQTERYSCSNLIAHPLVPDLAGPVAVLDNQHRVLSVVNVSVLLAAEQHKHPHDALFLANGDIVSLPIT